MRPDGGCVGYYTMVLVVNALLGLGRWWLNRSTRKLRDAVGPCRTVQHAGFWAAISRHPQPATR